MDEIHLILPRYFYAAGYEDRRAAGEHKTTL